MSYDKYIFYGISIELKKIITKGKGRRCSHPETQTPFCPICGEKMWTNIESEVYAEDILNSDEFSDFIDNNVFQHVFVKDAKKMNHLWVGNFYSVEEGAVYTLENNEVIRRSALELLAPFGDCLTIPAATAPVHMRIFYY